MEKEASMDYRAADGLRKEIAQMKKDLEKYRKSTLKARHEEEVLLAHLTNFSQ
jgi:pyruvate/oxaloacetate carboxyltransferase